MLGASGVVCVFANMNLHPLVGTMDTEAVVAALRTLHGETNGPSWRPFEKRWKVIDGSSLGSIDGVQLKDDAGGDIMCAALVPRFVTTCTLDSHLADGFNHNC